MSDNVRIITPNTPFAKPEVSPPTVSQAGPVVSAIRSTYAEPLPSFVVIIFRPDAPMSHRPFSTHNAYKHPEEEWCFESGHYDMAWTDAVEDMLRRANITI